MKMDESCINDKALMLINGLSLWDISSASAFDDCQRIMAMGYTQGVMDLADELKKVLHE